MILMKLLTELIVINDKVFYEQQKLSVQKSSEYSWEKRKIIKLCEHL